MPRDRISEHQGARPVKDGGFKYRKRGEKFDPSRCGGHKNLENAATFSKLLGQEDKTFTRTHSFQTRKGRGR